MPEDLDRSYSLFISLIAKAYFCLRSRVLMAFIASDLYSRRFLQHCAASLESSSPIAVAA